MILKLVSLVKQPLKGRAVIINTVRIRTNLNSHPHQYIYIFHIFQNTEGEIKGDRGKNTTESRGFSVYHRLNYSCEMRSIVSVGSPQTRVRRQKITDKELLLDAQIADNSGREQQALPQKETS